MTVLVKRTVVACCDGGTATVYNVAPKEHDGEGGTTGLCFNRKMDQVWWRVVGHH